MRQDTLFIALSKDGFYVLLDARIGYERKAKTRCSKCHVSARSTNMSANVSAERQDVKKVITRKNMRLKDNCVKEAGSVSISINSMSGGSVSSVSANVGTVSEKC